MWQRFLLTFYFLMMYHVVLNFGGTKISWIDWPSIKSYSNNFHRSTIQVANHAHSQVKQVHSILLLFHDLQLTGELDIQVSLIFDVGCHSLVSLVSSGNHTPGGVANCKGKLTFQNIASGRTHTSWILSRFLLHILYHTYS